MVNLTLEYREFPIKTAMSYWLFSPFFAYCIYFISGMTTSTLFAMSDQEHLFLLGIGSAFGALFLILSGILVDRTRLDRYLMYIGSLLPLFISILYQSIGFVITDLVTFETLLVFTVFFGLAATMLSWTVSLNKTVVVRHRGRIVSIFLVCSLAIYLIYDLLGTPLVIGGIPIPEVVAMAGVVSAIAFKTWKWKRHALAVQGNVLTYFIPVALVMAAHILWIFSTETELVSRGFIRQDETLGQLTGLALYEPVILAVGVFIAGLVADFLGRRRSFSTSVLLMGFLTIFGSAIYGLGEDCLWVLLVSERFIEGYLLGLCTFLVWTEIGSPKTKGLRTSFVWVFFLGYMALYWAVSLHAFGWDIPDVVGEIGNEFAILATLVALYQTGHLPQIVGRELEAEDLELDFDERQVKATVDAFLHDEDFESIKSQLDVIDATQEITDKELDEFLGEDLTQMMPLTRVQGIGAALEKKLRKAGYDSAAQLAGETPQRLSEKVEGLSEKQAQKLISNARKVVKRAVKPKKSK